MEPLPDLPIAPLRPDLEASPVTHEGEPFLLLSDPLGLRPETYAVAPLVVVIASAFDGQRNAEAVRRALSDHQVQATVEDIRQVAEELARLRILETPEVQSDRLRRLKEFRESSVRKFDPELRGLPSDPLELGVFLGRSFKDPKGPGERPAEPEALPPPAGLVSPHIDFFRGGPLYAWSYSELSRRQKPDVIVALGVAHFSPPSPWVMTRKAYETPFGPVKVDLELYDDICKALWYDPLQEEWVHAREHSLEFQALWIKHLWMQDTPRWVPILCSSFETFCGERSPSGVPTVEEAIRRIGEILAGHARKGRKVMVLAGIDLAHVGRKFGDELDVDDALKTRIETADRDSLDKALRLDAEGFFLSGVGEGAWRKVCGLSALYTSLRWIRALQDGQPLQGSLLAYDQAPDPAGGIVSFASAVYG